MVEHPNPRQPFGARGVGEVPIVPPMAAVANAIADATGIRMRDLPMSPPRLRAAIDQNGAASLQPLVNALHVARLLRHNCLRVRSSERSSACLSPGT
jgi:hypothetical protein